MRDRNSSMRCGCDGGAGKTKGPSNDGPFAVWLPDLGSNQGPTD
ncbi:hypothetical protein BURMUCGD1_2350, partial [Burkholderia multivorans CGD1]